MRPSVLRSATAMLPKTLTEGEREARDAGSVVNMLHNLVEVIEIPKVRNEVEKERGEKMTVTRK